MEKATDQEISDHFLKNYSGLFKKKRMKNKTKKVGVSKYAENEHKKHIVSLNNRIADIGTVTPI